MQKLHRLVEGGGLRLARIEAALADRPSDSGVFSTIVAAFGGLGYALSARTLLLLALIGAFVLAVVAMEQQSSLSLLVLVSYAAFAIVPVVVLEIRKSRS